MSISGPPKKLSDFDRLIEEDLVDFLIDRGVPVAAGAKPQQLRRLAKTEFRSGFSLCRALEVDWIEGQVRFALCCIVAKQQESVVKY